MVAPFHASLPSPVFPLPTLPAWFGVSTLMFLTLPCSCPNSSSIFWATHRSDARNCYFPALPGNPVLSSLGKCRELSPQLQLVCATLGGIFPHSATAFKNGLFCNFYPHTLFNFTFNNSSLCFFTQETGKEGSFKSLFITSCSSSHVS